MVTEPTLPESGAGCHRQDVSAVGFNLSRDSGLHENCGCRRLPEFVFQPFPLLEHGAEACSDLRRPVRDLVVAADLETRRFEARPVVGDSVVPEAQTRDAFRIKPRTLRMQNVHPDGGVWRPRPMPWTCRGRIGAYRHSWQRRLKRIGGRSPQSPLGKGRPVAHPKSTGSLRRPLGSHW